MDWLTLAKGQKASEWDSRPLLPYSGHINEIFVPIEKKSKGTPAYLVAVWEF